VWSGHPGLHVWRNDRVLLPINHAALARSCNKQPRDLSTRRSCRPVRDLVEGRQLPIRSTYPSAKILIRFPTRFLVMERAKSSVRTTPREADAIDHSRWILRCRMLQPGCHRFYLRWRKDKAPACANRRCRRKLYLLRKLRRTGRMTKEELQFELDAMAFDFVDSVPWEQRQRQYQSLKARVGLCEIRAEGCLGVALNWRKNRILARAGNRQAPMACGNAPCWRRAATTAFRDRRCGRHGAEDHA